MKVFLTGGTGFIGQPLTRQLLQRGWEVVAFVRRPQDRLALAIQAMGARLVQGDISNVDLIRSAMPGVDTVIHNAGAYEYGVNAQGKKRMYEINVNGTDNVLRIASELGITRTVYVSTTWAFGATGAEVRDETFQRNMPFLSYYEETKTRAHEIALRYQQDGLPLVIACPNGVIGPNDHSALGYFLRLYLNRLMLPFAWAPDATFTFVHVDDLVEGIALATEKGQTGETYIFAGEPLPLREIMAIWATKPGGFKVRFFIPSGLAYILFAPLEPLQRMLGLPAVISRELVRVSVNFDYSSQKAKDKLGWTHRSARQAWLDTIDGELELRNKREKRNPLALLKPL